MFSHLGMHLFSEAGSCYSTEVPFILTVCHFISRVSNLLSAIRQVLRIHSTKKECHLHADQCLLGECAIVAVSESYLAAPLNKREAHCHQHPLPYHLPLRIRQPSQTRDQGRLVNILATYLPPSPPIREHRLSLVLCCKCKRSSHKPKKYPFFIINPDFFYNDGFGCLSRWEEFTFL